MAKSPEDMADAMIANMKAKTGKTLAQWIAIAKKSGEATRATGKPGRL